MSSLIICREELQIGLAAKWVSVINCYMGRAAWGRPVCEVCVNNCYTWRGAWGRPGCQMGKCQQWLHVERSLERAWLPSG